MALDPVNELTGVIVDLRRRVTVVERAVSNVQSSGSAGVAAGNADLLDGQDGSYYLDLGNATGSLAAARLPAFTGDATSTAGTAALTLATVNATTGSFGSTTSVPVVTIDAKGRVTSAINTALRVATTAQTGIVQLSSATNSTSDTLAATPLAVKTAYDLAATYTAADVLAKLLTVDGTGSGLDADMIDGLHLTDLDTRFVNVSGDTMTGLLTAPNFTLSNPSIGTASKISFTKTNDSAFIDVTEYVSDQTLWSFTMTDNPDGPDKFRWYFNDWQGVGGDWEPLAFDSMNAAVRANNIAVQGDVVIQTGGWYTGGTSAAYARLSGLPATIATITKVGTIAPTFSASGYTATTSTPYWVKIDGTGTPNTFSWGTGATSATAVATGVPITGAAQTLQNGITVTWSATTGGALNDLWQVRAFRAANLRLGGSTTLGGGSGVFGIQNAITAPSSAPTGGGVLYVEAGALKYRGASGVGFMPQALAATDIPIVVKGAASQTANLQEWQNSAGSVVSSINAAGDHASSGVVTGSVLRSNVAIGTAPIIVTSTTAVANLNADLLDGQHGAYYNDWTNVTNKPSPTITVTLSGDVSGTAAVTLTSLSSGTIAITGTTIAANSVALGTDTTGNYVATVVGASVNQVLVSGSGTEDAAISLSLPQDIHTGATPTFSRLTLGQATGTAPLTVSSTTLVANLNAEYVGGVTLTGLDTRFVNATGDTMTGALTLSSTGQKINLFDANYGLGVQTNGTYVRTAQHFMVYQGGAHTDAEVGAGTGGTALLRVSNTGNIFQYKGNTIWHAGNDGTGSTLDADLLDGQHATYFAPLAEVEALLGDLLYVGTYNAGSYVNGNDATKPHPTWSGGSSVYRHGMYWIVSATGTLDFIDSDLSGRYSVQLDEPVEMFPGDWVIATDPAYNPVTGPVDLALSAVTFQTIRFSTETFVRAVVSEHATDAADPHSAAGYMLRNPSTILGSPVSASFAYLNGASTPATGTIQTATAHGFTPGSSIVIDGVSDAFDGSYTVLTTDSTVHFTYLTTGSTVASGAVTGIVGFQDGRRYADDVFAVIGHVHTQEINSAVADHEAAADPHPAYLLETAAAQTYAPVDHNHNGIYEALGTVAAHEAKPDPHAQYVTNTKADATYAPVVHYTRSDHDGRYAQLGHTHDFPIEVKATDGAASAKVWVGSGDPNALGLGVGIGDIWIEAPNIGLGTPATTTLTATTTSASSIALNWTPWPAAASLSSVTLEFSPDNTTWTAISGITTTQSTYTHTGRGENKQYFYRIRATNTVPLTSANATASATTTNAAPNPPTALVSTSITASAIGLSWTAPAKFSQGADSTDDPAALRYEVYIGNTLYTTLNTTTVSVTGLSENVAYTFSVRCKDSAGLTSTFATLGPTISTATPSGTMTANGVPGTPTGLAVLASVTSISMSWVAPSPFPADFDTYVIYKGDVQVATTTNTSYTMTGLSASTTYKVEVRTQDKGDFSAGVTNKLLSTDNACFINVLTDPSPDTSAPNNPTVTNFKPVSTYGAMRFQGTWAATTAFAKVEKSTNGADWTTAVARAAVTAGAPFDYGIGTYVAGQTVYVRTTVEDSALNKRTSGATTYTLIASPTYIAADATNHWRATNSGEYNAAGNYRPYQGYYSDAALTYRGLWYYGTKPYSQLYYGGRRTITDLNFLETRATAGGSAAAAPTLYLHKQTTNPGTVTGQAVPTFYTVSGVSPQTGAAVTTPAGGSDVAYTNLGAAFGQALVDGTYRGVGCYSAGTGTSYMAFSAVSENGYSGLLEFKHLG